MRRIKFKVVNIECKGRRYSSFTRGSYKLEYPENTIVRAREETLGVAVFKTRKQAEIFVAKPHSYLSFKLPFKIIHVRPIGRGKNVKFVRDFPSEVGLGEFYSLKRPAQSCRLVRPPSGTIFYPAVEVLD